MWTSSTPSSRSSPPEAVPELEEEEGQRYLMHMPRLSPALLEEKEEEAEETDNDLERYRWFLDQAVDVICAEIVTRHQPPQ